MAAGGRLVGDDPHAQRDVAWPCEGFTIRPTMGLRFRKVKVSGVWLGTAELARRILRRRTPTPAGDKPLASRSLRPRYIFSFRHRPSVYKSARFAGGEPASRLIGGHIPDRSPGHAFVAIAHPGWCRHTKV